MFALDFFFFFFKRTGVRGRVEESQRENLLGKYLKIEHEAQERIKGRGWEERRT